jgi:hypothetical protein
VIQYGKLLYLKLCSQIPDSFFQNLSHDSFCDNSTGRLLSLAEAQVML